MVTSPFPRLVVVPPSTSRATYLVRRFYPQATDAQSPMVAVALGFAPAGGLELQTLAGLSAGDARGLVATATANVKAGPRTWHVAEKAGFLFKKPSLLRGMGDLMVPVPGMSTDGMGVDDLSTDLVLDEGMMAQAGQLLGATELIAAIPKRGWLLVGKCVPGQLPVMMKFREIASGIASRGGRHALTANGYFFQRGKLHGVAGDMSVSLITDPSNPWNLE